MNYILHGMTNITLIKVCYISFLPFRYFGASSVAYQFSKTCSKIPGDEVRSKQVKTLKST